MASSAGTVVDTLMELFFFYKIFAEVNIIATVVKSITLAKRITPVFFTIERLWSLSMQ